MGKDDGGVLFLAIYWVTQIASLATSSAASAAGKSSSQVGIITGLVVGLGLGFGLILVDFFLIWSRKHRDQKDSEECSPLWSLEEANELPSPTPMIHMPGKTLSEVPDGQDALQHELPHNREFPSELDNGIINRRSVA